MENKIIYTVLSQDGRPSPLSSCCWAAQEQLLLEVGITCNIRPSFHEEETSHFSFWLSIHLNNRAFLPTVFIMRRNSIFLAEMMSLTHRDWKMRVRLIGSSCPTNISDHSISVNLTIQFCYRYWSGYLRVETHF